MTGGKQALKKLSFEWALLQAQGLAKQVVGWIIGLLAYGYEPPPAKNPVHLLREYTVKNKSAPRVHHVAVQQRKPAYRGRQATDCLSKHVMGWPLLSITL